MHLIPSKPLFPAQEPQLKADQRPFKHFRFSGHSSHRSLPTSPTRSSLRSSLRSPGASPCPKKIVSFKVPTKTDDLKWKKDLISEFNFEIPKKFDYRVSYVRPIGELATARDHITTADFWPFRQKLQFVKNYNLGPLLKRKRERNPAYELRLIARLSQPLAPYQMDSRLQRYMQERKTVKDLKLMNNNEDPWGYIKPQLPVYAPAKPTIDEWANHPMYRPASSAETRARQGENRKREEQLEAFIEAIDLAEKMEGE